MTKASLDTNVLLRLILNDVKEQHEIAMKIFDSGELFYISPLVMAETIFALNRYYELGREDISLIMNNIILNPQVVTEEKIISKALNLYSEHPALSFEGCFLASEAICKERLPLLTFDKKLANQIDGASLIK